MTKRDSKRKQGDAKLAKPPKVKKERLKDIDAKDKGEAIKGGASRGCKL